MYVRKLTGGKNARLIACFGVLIVGGCGTEFGSSVTEGPRSTLNLSTLGLDSESTYYEANPNHQFELAEVVETADEPRVIRGRIGGIDDVDVYDLGPVLPGDHIVVNMTAADSLDGAIALFDATATALLVNDHRNVYLGKREPFIDVVIQHESEACYVAVCATPGFASTGDYGLVVSREFPVDPPHLRPDVVLFVFDGADSARIGSRSPVDVPVFDAANISPVYSGQTDTMVREILARVREDYEAFDVTILSTSEGDFFEPGMTRLFFGTYDEALLGVAEGVDEFNATTAQEAIVFTDTFAAFMRLDPSVEQMSQAIANVASHETGHLLGMIHTHDPSGIMDVTASLAGLMQNQAFTRSPLYTAVYPLGYQDAVQYLLDAVGGDPNLAFAKVRAERRMEIPPNDGDHPPARAELCLSSCCLDEH